MRDTVIYANLYRLAEEPYDLYSSTKIKLILIQGNILSCDDVKEKVDIFGVTQVSWPENQFDFWSTTNSYSINLAAEAESF